jgi:hypothetical protein
VAQVVGLQWGWGPEFKPHTAKKKKNRFRTYLRVHLSNFPHFIHVETQALSGSHSLLVIVLREPDNSRKGKSLQLRLCYVHCVQKPQVPRNKNKFPISPWNFLILCSTPYASLLMTGKSWTGDILHVVYKYCIGRIHLASWSSTLQLAWKERKREVRIWIPSLKSRLCNGNSDPPLHGHFCSRTVGHFCSSIKWRSFFCALSNSSITWWMEVFFFINEEKMYSVWIE